MKKISTLKIVIISATIFLAACTSRSGHENISTDSAVIAKGEELFKQNCSACHNFRQDAIGPQLAGVTEIVTAEHLKRFIKDPQAVIASGDEHAKALVEKFHAVMPSFASYSDEDLNGIIAYLNTKKTPSGNFKDTDTTALKDPIPQKIATSDLVITFEPFCQIPASNKELPHTRINKLVSHPDTKELFILDLRGKLYRIVNKKPQVYLDMPKLRPAFIDKPGLATGFGSFAFHPEFEKNGLLYTTHTESPTSGKADFAYHDSIPVTVQWVLTEWKAKKSNAFPFEGEGRELFRINMPSGIHGVQDITFNEQANPGSDDFGLLYIGIGDGGSAEEGFLSLPHSRQNPWGAILRIDPSGRDSKNKKYGIPKNNPFVKEQDPKTLREIFAYGFRNPHLFTWTTGGDMLATNIGHGNIESLNLIVPGADYGWPQREGNFVLNPYGNLNKVFALPEDDATYHFTYPVAEYDHDEGKAICGGFEYTGSRVPELKGKYLFGDIPTGGLFYVEVSDLHHGKMAEIKRWRLSLGGKISTLEEICKTGRVDVRFGRDASGEMYLFTKPDGNVYKLTGTLK
jgi:glucose/arabinose dehydrogenase/cytochrome c2